MKSSKHQNNPSVQCSVCGQWKRLTRKTGDHAGMQTFYPVCQDSKGNIYEHIKPVCDECCKEKCPYNHEKRIKIKYEIDEEVTAVKDDCVIIGKITEVIPEMQYEITDGLGNIRTVDHAHILGPGRLSRQAILFATGKDDLPY